MILSTMNNCCYECSHHDIGCIPSCYPEHCHNKNCPCHTEKVPIQERLEDCSGCTDDRSEGTHQMHTKQHPCPKGGDPNCGYCAPLSETKNPSTDSWTGSLDNAVRDICGIPYRSKSEVRRILEGLLSTETEKARRESQTDYFEAGKQAGRDMAVDYIRRELPERKKGTKYDWYDGWNACRQNLIELLYSARATKDK